MNDILILIVSILPVFLIGLYIYKKDHDKESTKLLSKLFFFGVACVFPAAFVELLFGIPFGEPKYLNYISLFAYVFIGVALVEEFFKWLVTYTISFKNKEFDYQYDAIVYSVFVALGFAFFENILYIGNAGINSLGTGIIRAFLAVPGHAGDAIIMGYYLGLARLTKRNNNPSKSVKYILLSIFIPTITHGLYDYCLFTGTTAFIIIFFIFVITFDIICIKKVKKISSNNISFLNNNEDKKIKIRPFCSKCGEKSIGLYCIRCGNKIDTYEE